MVGLGETDTDIVKGPRWVGFRGLHLFNVAMLARQAWRLLVNPKNLCGRVLKAKYFPNNNIMDIHQKGDIIYVEYAA